MACSGWSSSMKLVPGFCYSVNTLYKKIKTILEIESTYCTGCVYVECFWFVRLLCRWSVVSSMSTWRISSTGISSQITSSWVLADTAIRYSVMFKALHGVNSKQSRSGLILHGGNRCDCIHAPWSLPWCSWNVKEEFDNFHITMNSISVEGILALKRAGLFSTFQTVYIAPLQEKKKAQITYSKEIYIRSKYSSQEQCVSTCTCSNLSLCFPLLLFLNKL